MPTQPLSQKEIEDRLRELPGWSVESDRLLRTYRLGDHFAATALVVHVARIQQELDHHSDLTLGYNTVALSVNTHSMRRDRHREGLPARRTRGGNRPRPRRRLTRRSLPFPP